METRKGIVIFQTPKYVFEDSTVFLNDNMTASFLSLGLTLIYQDNTTKTHFHRNTQCTKTLLGLSWIRNFSRVGNASNKKKKNQKKTKALPLLFTHSKYKTKARL